MFDLTGKITPKENYLRLIRGENPQYFCHNAIRFVCDEYVPAGRLAPEVPNGAPLTPGSNEIIVDEMNAYGGIISTD
jgi:hypothetical protein